MLTQFLIYSQQKFIKRKTVGNITRVNLWQQIIVRHSNNQEWISTFTLNNSIRLNNVKSTNRYCSLQLVDLLGKDEKRSSLGLCSQLLQPRKPLKNLENTEKSSCMSIEGFNPPENTFLNDYSGKARAKHCTSLRNIPNYFKMYK